MGEAIGRNIYLSDATATKQRGIKMFNLDNTIHFTQSDCDLLNQAASVLVDRGMDDHNALDIVNNNWSEFGNTVESLIAR